MGTIITMTFRPLILATLILLTSCSQDDQSVIRPSWEKGDVKYYDYQFTNLGKVNDDTIANVTVEKSLRLAVIEKTSDGYIIEVTNLAAKNFKLTSYIDSIETKFNNSFDILQEMTKNYIPFKVRVSNNGELLNIVDFDDYYLKFVENIVGIKDTLKITEEDKRTLQQIFPSDNREFKEKLTEALAKEITDLFDIYNTQNPSTGDVKEEIVIANPRTGDPINSTLTYHTNSITERTHEIEMTATYDNETLTDILTKDTVLSKDKKFTKQYLDNLVSSTKYFLDPKTNWVDSIISKVYYKVDSVEINFTTNIKRVEK